QARIGHVLYLPAEQIPVDRHLLELGVDSLMAMELIRGLERDYGLRIYPREVLEQPDIATLATYLAAEVARRAGPAHAAQAAPHPPTERQGAS
ncbi:acyl carrier protein, partial [Enterococcus faecium]|uniref:acyl carrier protein n=1 Tax=Enterococcus faecium TaxID=1352 RepID=UPI003F444C83